LKPLIGLLLQSICETGIKIVNCQTCAVFRHFFRKVSSCKKCFLISFSRYETWNLSKWSVVLCWI